MATVFSRIIQGELPARFVWSDGRCVAFLSINPLRRGHVLVVPRVEVDHWLDLDADEWAHLTAVSKDIGRALQHVYKPEKVGMMLAGLEVPHVHVHLVPIDTLADLNFARAEVNPDPAALDSAADEIRAALRELGYDQVPG
jgi:histidine triad (HIT) family protein